MSDNTLSPRSLLGSLLLAVATFWISTPPAGAEIAAAHLVYEKLVKMKKAEVVLYLPFFDQSRKSDNAARLRTIECTALADGKKGSLPVRGTFRLELLGETSGASSAWTSRTLSTAVTDGGAASFESDDIQALVDDATKANARIDMFEIEFDGGRGKKVATLTVDCIHREAE